MKKQLFKRFVSLLLVVCMVLAYVPAANAASVTWKETDQKINVAKMRLKHRSSDVKSRNVHYSVH